MLVCCLQRGGHAIAVALDALPGAVVCVIFPRRQGAIGIYGSLQ